MDWQRFGELLASLIGGGFIVAVFNYATEGRKLKIADKNDLLERMNLILQHCEDDKKQLNTLIEANTRRELEMQAELKNIKNAQLEIVMPCWRTTIDHRYLSINEAACQMILGPLGMHREDVLGLTADQIWAPEVSRVSDEMDQKALLSPIKCATVLNLSLHKDLPRFNVTKYVTYVNDPVSPVGFINYAIPCELTDDERAERRRRTQENLELEDDNDD